MALTIKTNKCCYFCDNNLLVGAAVPLFTVTKNKDFTDKSCFTVDSIVLAELLKSVGLNINANTSSSPPVACKKWARKIVNCSTLFHDTRENCESQDREQFAVCKTATCKSFSKRFYTRSKEGEGYCSRAKRTARTKTKATESKNESSKEILIWIKRDLGWARKSWRCCSVVAFIFQITPTPLELFGRLSSFRNP